MKKTIVIGLLLLAEGSLFGQSSLQQYTPSVLLNRGQMEIKLFNNLYTQTKVRDENGTTIDLGERQSFLNHQLRYLYGVSNESRINIGMEVNVTSAWYGTESSGAMLTSIGPTLKFVPLKDRGNFSVQSTFLLPLNGDQLESPRFINHNRYTWWTQFFYDHSINAKWNIFFEADLLYRFKADELQNDFFRVPISTILSYFPSSKWTVYGTFQYAAAYGKLPEFENPKFGRMRWFSQIGAGAKYLFLNNIEIEVSYANFLWSRRDGAGQAFNLGLRILR